MRNGTGSPVLCNPHRVALESQVQRDSRAPVKRAGEALGDLIGDFLGGKPLDPDKAAAALDGMFGDLGGIFKGYSPDLKGAAAKVRGFTFQGGTGPAGSPFGAAFHGFGGQQQQQQPPPGPPGVSREEAIEACRELGLGSPDSVTIEEVNQARKKLARKHHPDRGGSTEKMGRINNAADVVLEYLQPKKR